MTTKTPEQTTHWLAPFSVRSFKFQWPSDLATSWAFEMETLILGWYILVESGSVMLLVVFGALQFFGALAVSYTHLTLPTNREV